MIMAGSIIFTFLSDDSLTGFPTGAGGCSSKNVSGRFLETHIKLFDKNSLNRMNPEIISGKRLPEEPAILLSKMVPGSNPYLWIFSCNP